MQAFSPRYFDVHTHVQFATYQDDYTDVVERAFAAGVWMINVGTQYDTSDSAVRLAESYEHGMFATVGLHPIHTTKSYHDENELGGEKGFYSREEVFETERYRAIAEHPKVVAIGECGLDYYRADIGTKEKQISAFLGQMLLARDVGKPLMVHCRDAFDDLVDLITAHKHELPERSGIIHFFTGTVAHARILADFGFSFSFGGVTTFTTDYDEAIRFLPKERIVSETDAPYVSPVPYRGKRNEPAHIVEVVARLAEIRGEDTECVREQLVANARQLFGV